MVWITFLISSIFVIIAGIKLSYYGDIIAEKSGMGRTLVGMILISMATSLPELVTSLKAISLNNSELVFGNLFGSNLFNLAILILIDFWLRKKSVYSVLEIKTEKSALASIVPVLIMMLSITILSSNVSGFNLQGDYFAIQHGMPVILGVGLDSILVILAYLYILKKVFFKKHDDEIEPATEEVVEDYGDKTLKNGVVGFSIAAIVIVFAGLALTEAADEISKLKIGGVSLGGSFVGSLFLAMVTSLPELVATIGAMRLKAYNMAMGNIFGSNIFNILILAITDIFYRKGSITNSATFGKSSLPNPKILITIVLVVLITVLVSLTASKDHVKKRRITNLSMLILLMFILNQVILFFLR